MYRDYCGCCSVVIFSIKKLIACQELLCGFDNYEFYVHKSGKRSSARFRMVRSVSGGGSFSDIKEIMLSCSLVSETLIALVDCCQFFFVHTASTKQNEDELAKKSS